VLGALMGSPAYFPLESSSPVINAGSNMLVPEEITTDQAGNARIQGGVVDMGAIESSFTSRANLILNSDFSIPIVSPNFPLYWTVYGLPTAPPWSISDSIFHFHRAAGSTQSVVYQNTNMAVPANTVLQAQFDLGNNSSVRKRALVLIHDADFSDSSACTFWLPANTPLRTYRMKLHTTETWTNATLSTYASDPADGLPSLQLDNVSLIQPEGDTFQGTLCEDADVPAPLGGIDGANLLDNGDFSQPLNPSSALDAWSYFNQINVELVGEVAEIHRVGSPRGNLFQEDLTVTSEGVPLEATFQMGNSHSQRMRVVLLLHKRNFGDLAVCTFWLAPNTPLQSYTMRMGATIDWTDGTAISFYLDTLYMPSPPGRVLLDNVTLRQRPGLTVAGTECYEPGQFVPSPAMPLIDTPTVDSAPEIGELPLVLPPGELPLIVTPSPIQPASEADGEGEFTEEG
jgi:hypothetical protein